MTYTTDDLKYIFVRVGAKNVSLEEMDDKDFIEWAEERFQIKIKDGDMVVGMPWTNKDKVDFLNDMSERAGGQHVVVMLKH